MIHAIWSFCLGLIVLMWLIFLAAGAAYLLLIIIDKLDAKMTEREEKKNEKPSNSSK